MSYYLYNNEAIGAFSIAAVLKSANALSYSKSLLILPFLFHEETTSFLKRSNAVARSSEEIIVKRVEHFGNFNARYYSLLPVSINSIMILKQMGEINISKTNISLRPEGKLSLDSNNIGKRAESIIKAAPKLANLLLEEDDQSLYLKLRIQL